MPILNEHPYQDDFRRARSNYSPQISSPTVTNQLPLTESTVDHIQFRNHLEAPEADVIAQNELPQTLTPTTDPYTDPYQLENGSPVPVRPSTTNQLSKSII